MSSIPLNIGLGPEKTNKKPTPAPTREQVNQRLHQQAKQYFQALRAYFKQSGASEPSLQRLEKKLLGPDGLLKRMANRTPFGVGDDALNLAVLQMLWQSLQNPGSGLRSLRSFETDVDGLLQDRSEADTFFNTAREFAKTLRAAHEPGHQSDPLSPTLSLAPGISKQKGWVPFAAGMMDGVWGLGAATALSALGLAANPIQGLRDLKNTLDEGATALKFLFSNLPQATQIGAQAVVKAIQNIPGLSDYDKGKLLVQAVLVVITTVGAVKAATQLTALAKKIKSGEIRHLNQVKTWLNTPGNSGLNAKGPGPKIPQKINLQTMSSRQLLEEIKKLTTPAKAATWFDKNQPILKKNKNFIDLKVQNALRNALAGNGVPKNIPRIVAQMKSINIIGEDATIGISQQNSIQIPSSASTVSRQHAKILDSGNGPLIVDLNSSYGTWVNGKRIPAQEPISLQEFSKVFLGDPNNPNSAYEFIYISKEVQKSLQANPFMNATKFPTLQSIQNEGKKIAEILAQLTLPQDKQNFNNALKNVFEAELARFRDNFEPNLLESKIFSYQKYKNEVEIYKNITIYERFGRYPGNHGKAFSQDYIKKNLDAENFLSEKIDLLKKINQSNFVRLIQEQHKILNYKSPYPGLIRPNQKVFATRASAADYTNAIFRRYQHLDLGEAPDGKINIDGIPNNSQPTSINSGHEIGLHIYPDSLNPYFQKGSQLFEKILIGIQKKEDPKKIQELIGMYYHVMVNARPFYQTNNSLFMNQVNVLLKRTGHSGFRNHGDLDHLFMRVNSQQAQKLWLEALKGNFPTSQDFGITIK